MAERRAAVVGTALLRAQAALLPTLLLAAGAVRQEPMGPAPGTPGYPVTNPNARQTLHISGVLPSTLPIQLFAAYQSAAQYTESPCGRWAPAAGVGFPLLVLMPIDTSESRAGFYDATVLVDKFEPGKCGWRFHGIAYTVAGVHGDGFVSEFSDLAPPDADRSATRWCGTDIHPLLSGKRCLGPGPVFAHPSSKWINDPRRA